MHFLWTVLLTICSFKGVTSNILTPSRLFPALSPVDIWVKKCPPKTNCPVIPEKCRMVNIFWNKGYLCRGCDKEKSNCKILANQKAASTDGCPVPTDCAKISKGCSIPVYFWIHGKRCRGCNMRIPGCSTTGEIGTIKHSVASTLTIQTDTLASY